MALARALKIASILWCSLSPRQTTFQVATRRVGKGFEKMKKHLRGHLSNLHAFELHVPYDPVPAAEVDQHPRIGIVHGQGEAIALHPPFVAQGQGKGLSQSDPRVLYRVVFVYVQVSVDLHW